MDALLSDLRLAVRRLRLSPAITVFAVASLAVGIGTSTAIYSAVRTLFWIPLGIAQPEQTVEWTAGPGPWSVSWLDFLDVRAQQVSFSSMGAASPLSAAIAIGDVVETAYGESVSGDYFTTLGVSALYGRVLQPQDEASAARVAVVSEAFWRTRLHADPEAIGRSFTLSGERFELIGVTRGSFHGLAQVLPGAVWIPTTAVPDRGHTGWPARKLNDRSLGTFSVLARLKPGVALAQARAEATLIAQHLDTTFPVRSPYADGRVQRRAWVLTEGTHALGEADRLDALGAAILFAVVSVLLIACTNLANLSLAKGTSRAQETAVRIALGASRGRLVREHLVESAVVTLAGAGLGLVLLSQLTRIFETDLPVAQNITMHFKPEVSTSVLVASVCATTIALLVVGLWPALQSTRTDVRSGLGAGVAATPLRWRLHRRLVAWQVAGSVAMVLIAAMCARVTAAVDRDPGIDYRSLALAQVDFALNGEDEARGRAVLGDILSKARTHPRIQHVSASSGLPFGLMAPGVFATLVDKPFTETRDTGKYSNRIAATPEIFSTLGLQIVHGRAFTDRDDAAAPLVTVLSEGIARELFQTTDVVGRSISVSMSPRLRKRKGETPLTYDVIGVSKDTDTFIIGKRGDPVIFVPLAQQYEPRLVVVARSQNPAAVAAALRSIVRTAAPDLALSAVGTGERLLLGPYFVLRIIASLAGVLGGVALLLAMVGLYGVLSHVVARRTREIGIRIAMGADSSRIVSLVLRDGFRPVLMGLLMGLFAGVALRVILKAIVVTSINPIDLFVFSVVPVPFGMAAIAACYFPAARAARVDPNAALRDL